MPKAALETLTESMFYVLMAFDRAPMCGIDAASFVESASHGRVLIGPATLYTVIGRFESAKYIEETLVEGRKRTYRITKKGTEAYNAEIQRLGQCLADAAAAPRFI